MATDAPKNALVPGAEFEAGMEEGRFADMDAEVKDGSNVCTADSESVLLIRNTSQASLFAKGYTWDAHAEKASSISNSAYAKFAIDHLVEKHGNYLHVAVLARNQIQFSYDWDAGDSHLKLAEVEIFATSVDLKGGGHSYHAANHTGSTTGQTQTQSISETSKLEATAGLSSEKGKEATLTGGGTETHASSDTYSVTHGPGATKGGQTRAVVIPDSYTAPLEHRIQYSIRSAATIRLKVKTVEPGKKSWVRLEEYSQVNEMQAWYALLREPTDPAPPPPPPGTPMPPGPTTPSGNPGAPSSGGSSGGSSTADGFDDEMEDNANAEKGAQWSVDVEPPRGTLSELESGNARPGVIYVFMNTRVTNDLEIQISGDSAGAIDLNGNSVLTIPAGRYHAAVPFFAGASPGEVDLTLTVLDSSGQPTTDEITKTVTTTEFADHTSGGVLASVSVDHAEAAPGGIAVRATRKAALVLDAGIHGWADWETEGTTLDVQILDPDDILPSLPSEITIGAGESFESMHFQLNDAIGEAEITVSNGAESRKIYIASIDPEWVSASGIRIPLGAKAYVPIICPTPLAQSLSVSGTVQNLNVASIDSAHVNGQTDLGVGDCLGALWLNGLSLGTTTLTLQSTGYTSIQVPIQVFTPTVSYSNSKVTLGGLTAARNGSIRLSVPDGMTITSLMQPANSVTWLTISGTGTDEVILDIVGEAGMPTSVELTIAFDGQPDLGDPRLIVMDGYEPASTLGWRNSASWDLSGQ